MFISRSSLWTNLDFANVDKTQTYIQRSKTSPLNIILLRRKGYSYLDDAFSLVIPHVCRLQSLFIRSRILPYALTHFRCHTPLLEELDISIDTPDAPMLDSTLFGGDLPSLRELSLSGVVTRLPWKNLANLRYLYLRCPPEHGITVTRFLDFFESAPLLQVVETDNSIPNSSDAPHGRMVPLRHLKSLTIGADPAHSVILNHLYIPTGTSMLLWTRFGGREFPLLDYLPEKSPNFKNLSHITTVNLCFERHSKFAQVSGPSGSLRLAASWDDQGIPSSDMDHLILRSLRSPTFSSIRRLAVSGYHPILAGVTEYPVFQTLSTMNNLQTLILSQGNELPFITALDPGKHPSGLVLCPNLRELALYATSLQYHKRTEDLINMAKNRDLSGAKLSSIMVVVSTGVESTLKQEVFKLGEYAMCAEYYEANYVLPAWDYVPGASGSTFRK